MDCSCACRLHCRSPHLRTITAHSAVTACIRPLGPLALLGICGSLDEPRAHRALTALLAEAAQGGAYHALWVVGPEQSEGASALARATGLRAITATPAGAAFEGEVRQEGV